MSGEAGTTNKGSNNMKKILVALLTATLLMFATPAHTAEPTNYFGTHAKVVAEDIGCRDFRNTFGKSYYKMTSGVCFLKGKRVNVFAFEDTLHQFYWKIDAQASLPANFWWAQGKGVVIVAKDGNRNAAVTGAKSVDGSVRHG